MIRSRRKWLWLLVVAAAFVAVLIWRFMFTEPAIRPDPAEGWRIQFGRGSGWHGLDTVKIASDGTVVLHRLNRGERVFQWEATSFTLPPNALAKVFASIEKNHLMDMERKYQAHVADGTQWIFWIRQQGTVKSVYFNNEFPGAIEKFADDLDQILAENGLGSAVWRSVLERERQHERELWDSIKTE